MTVTVETGSAQQWTAFGTIALAIATLAAVGWAVFHEGILSWLRRPKLALRILPQPPDCLKIPWNLPTGGQCDSYCLRAEANNTGRKAAEKVEVFLGEVLEETANASFARRRAFIPMNLSWADLPGSTMFLDHLSRDVPKHCGVAHIIDPAARTSIRGEDNPALGLSSQQTALSLDLVVKPTSFSYLLPPGTYRLKLILGAANAKPVTKWVEIVHTGQWFADEEQMLSVGLQIRLLSDYEVELVAS